MPFRRLQYLIFLISNRAILFDINDIKECHKNLTEGRLPTIKSYRIHRKKGGEQEPPPFLEIQKGKAAEKKKRAEKERACVAPTPKKDSLITGEKNYKFSRFWQKS